MRVKTPAIKLEVSLESVEIEDGDIKFEGMAGMMPCETHISPREEWALVGLCLRPRILGLLIKALFSK